MQVGDIMVVRASAELISMGLIELSGRCGRIMELVRRKDGSVRGCWLELIGGAVLEDDEWYVPVDSLIPFSRWIL